MIYVKWWWLIYFFNFGMWLIIVPAGWGILPIYLYHVLLAMIVLQIWILVDDMMKHPLKRGS